MPVNSSQYEGAKRVVSRMIDEAHNLEGQVRLYQGMKNIRPKGFRGSILKFIDWPTSWAVLYDLSPAQVSQDREATLASRAWQSTTLTGTDNPSDARKLNAWMRLLKAYFAGNPDPMSESNFPNWRKPSWMTPADEETIKNLISNAYQAEAPLETTMPVEDGEVSLSAEQTEDVPREQRMADLAEQEEAEAVQIEEEQAEEQNDGGRSLIDNLYALYQPYWRRSHNVESEGDLYNRRGNIDIRRALIAILTLEKLGYGHRGIKDFTNSMQQRGLQIFGLRRASRSGYNAYLLVDLKGANANASRYRSSTGYGIMGMASRIAPGILKPQFEPGQGRALQIMRFTRRGNSLAGFQVLSLNVLNGERNAMTMQEGNRQFSTANNESIAQLDAATTATGTTIQPPEPTVEGAETRFYFMGSQAFSPGMTYRQEAQLFYDVEGLNLTSDERSYAFYFVSPQNGEYKLYRSVFSPMRLAVNSLVGLKEAWSDSGQLSEPRKLKLVEISDVQNKRRLRKMFLQAHDNTNAYVSSMMMRPVRSSNMQTSVDFEVIKRIGEIQPAFTDYLRGLVGAANDGSTSTQINILSQNQCRILSESPYSFGFGIEFEGFVREGTRKQLSENLRADGVKVYSTQGYQQTRPVRGEEQYVEGHRWRQEADSSVTGFQANTSGGYDPSGQGQTFEMVSVILNESVDNKSGNNDWIPEIEQYCEALAKNGVLIDPSSGIHIHVGYSNFDAEQTKNFFINSVLMLPVLKGLVSEAWKGRGYAKFPSNSNLASKLSKIANAGNTQNSVVNAYRDGFGEERYSWLNTVNYGSGRKPTFEFRFQGSSIEKDTMVNTIKILQQIWKASLEGVIPIEAGAGKSQDQVLIDLLGTPLYAFARNRYAETELPSATQMRSNSFKGFDFPISASQIQ